MPTVTSKPDDGLFGIRGAMNKAWASSPDEGYRWARVAVRDTCRKGLEGAGVRNYNNVDVLWKVRRLLRHGGTV